MKYESKHWDREGDYFVNRRHLFDLSRLKCLHSGVDTVKQLFSCQLRIAVLREIAELYESEEDSVMIIHGIDWEVSKSSKSAGYQWILKNLDAGYVILLKSFYNNEDTIGSHVKIEVTPQKIASTTPLKLTREMNEIAHHFGTEVRPVGVAIHIAVDLHGFEVPKDFEHRLATKARRQSRYNGISQADFQLAETCAIYGQTQSYTFGGAGGLQFQLYDKTAEAIKKDKIDYWESVWQKTTSEETFPEPIYQHGDQVNRIEMRFHHSVIQQFCNGTKDEDGEFIQIRTFHEACRHLTALWIYSLENFRLQHSTTYIDPVWQKLIEDVQIYEPSPCLLYKRAPKKPGEQTRRNVAMWLGNQLKLMARRGFKIEFATRTILSSGLDSELMDYFGLFGPEERLELGVFLAEFIKEKFDRLRREGIAV